MYAGERKEMEVGKKAAKITLHLFIVKRRNQTAERKRTNKILCGTINLDMQHKKERE
jgi:hypothetical protein